MFNDEVLRSTSIPGPNHVRGVDVPPVVGANGFNRVVWALLAVESLGGGVSFKGGELLSTEKWWCSRL
jgi:hypothetical protein